ncbi:MAG: glycosyltransferase family 2 protein, partial [Selenomonadaceae bacterium]|nr:glycosyltransferase family 2 protein [Selenomonadaceae bacterium]
MTREPIVSVVIPVYNGSNFLKYAIESALSQTYRKCEIIVINDGSDDQGITKKIAKSYGVKIKYAEQENRGTAAALNHGLRLMNGEYFVWLSHDDTLMPYKVEAQLEAIRKSGNEDTIAQGNYSFINEATGGFVSTRFHEHYPIEPIHNGCFLFLWGETHFSNLLFSS